MSYVRAHFTVCEQYLILVSTVNHQGVTQSIVVMHYVSSMEITYMKTPYLVYDLICHPLNYSDHCPI